jgi:hypothetical protein
MTQTVYLTLVVSLTIGYGCLFAIRVYYKLTEGD